MKKKLETMSGLEILKAISENEMQHPSIAITVPMFFKTIESGFVEFEATANEMHLNPMGGTHGGFAATVLDSVTGCAVHSMLEAGVFYGTIDLNVKMVRPVPLNVKLIAQGKVINMSRSLGVSEGWLRDSDDKLLAHATCTCLIKRN